jgi:hypothetical protein
VGLQAQLLDPLERVVDLGVGRTLLHDYYHGLPVAAGV